VIDTPAAVVSLERLERNLDRWQAECDRSAWRTAQLFRQGRRG
jgi:D-serine deaminase-like pyridoxal phosphate-dependent protein